MNTLEFRLETLARENFSDLTDAEIKLLRAIPKGNVAVCGPNALPGVGNHPGSAASWGTERQIRADLIRWLCVCRSARDLTDPRGIQICGAKIVGSLDLFCATVPFPLMLEYCHLGDEINLRYANILGINLHGSWVESIAADGAQVQTNALFRSGFHAKGQVRFAGARVGGTLEFDHSTIENPIQIGISESGLALVADGIIVKGAVFLRNGFSAIGEIRFLGAQIGGHFDCSNARFRNPLQNENGLSAISLNADSMRVDGSIFLNNGFHGEGEVSVVGSHIDGNLDCSNATLVNSRSGIALAADRVVVGKSVLIGGEGFRADGEIRLLGSQIGCDLACDGAKLRAPRYEEKIGRSLSAHTATVLGHVFLRHGFRADGEVAVSGGHVRGNLECTGSSFRGGLNLQSISVEGVLLWRNALDREHLVLDLENASFGALADSTDSWPLQGKLLLDGLVYERFVGGAPKDVKNRLDWLSRQKDFALQPYRQLARILRSEGDDRGARHVLFDMEHRRRAKEDRKWYWRVWDWALNTTVGYGYFPGRSLRWLAWLIVVGWLFFWAGYRTGNIVPTDTNAYGSFKSTGDMSGSYVRFHPLIYSADNVLPLVKLGQVDRWQPDPGSDRYVSRIVTFGDYSISVSFSEFLQWLRLTQILFGWFFATMGIAAVTGLVHND